MPQRFLRPGITTSDRWNAVSFGAQSLYIRLLTLVDDFGRYDARIPIIHGQCFALRNDVTPQDSAGFRSELVSAGLIEVYSVDGKEYLQFTKWQERARSDKSKFPDSSQGVEISTPAAECSGMQRNPASLVPRSSPSTIDQTPSTIATPRKRGGVRANGSIPLSCPAFAEFWIAYPHREGKADAEAAWIKHNCASILPQILTTIRAAKLSRKWTDDGGKWIPMPATWLNRRGWEDELLPRNGETPRKTYTLADAYADDAPPPHLR